MARKIVITSGKGGVGKTTLVSVLGVTLARMGYKTMLIDMDFGLNNLDVLMGIENKIVYDIIDCIEGKCQARQALIQDFFEHNLYIFPSTHGFCSVKFGSKELLKIIGELESLFDFVIIDCPAGIDGGFRRAIECANEFVVVTTPHLSAVRDADKVIRCLQSNLRNSPYLIINRARGDMMLNNEMLTIESLGNFLSAELIGVIPEDDLISKQMLTGEKLGCNSLALASIEMVANNIITGNKQIFDCTKKYRGLLGSIRKNLKGRL